ncbi:hypothetical protein [Clostridium acetobutylicum]|uniref:Uncharacterized protein n=2 Tax=Clostridiaceae TaxID=31979 RepID=Q97LD9_CLOAB|nr:Hypothetical protein CA_C0623 [Clostridium acetobutylicum ATCC 824]AEI31343.1 hypothetical protein SMB_G0637 [Clostridium acetobutylicum DSM 1731]AWV80324.1 hypothetical protein DK921_09490 [Clostridium acetobutylicum]PSM06126.1 hypothetical protein C7T89_09485 [Clostridium sp. NJ4]MBC2392510.1 hypothetical protein [Clostridium acetobutylicum]
MDDKKTYAPHMRNYFEQRPKDIRSYSEYDYTPMPDPVVDPIVSNNIATWEFDYTYNGDDDVFKTSKYLN